jgi:hypothetical protein
MAKQVIFTQTGQDLNHNAGVPLTLKGVDKIVASEIIPVDDSVGVTVGGVQLANGYLFVRAIELTNPLGTQAEGTELAEYGDGNQMNSVIEFTDLVIGTPTAGGNKGMGVKIYTFPEDTMHLCIVSSISVGLTVGGVTTDTPDMGLGSVIATGTVAVLSGTATFEDYITGQTASDCAGTTVIKALGATAGIGTGIALNQVGDVKDVFLNVADGWNAGVTGDLTATGRIVLSWFKL